MITRPEIFSLLKKVRESSSALAPWDEDGNYICIVDPMWAPWLRAKPSQEPREFRKIGKLLRQSRDRRRRNRARRKAARERRRAFWEAAVAEAKEMISDHFAARMNRAAEEQFNV